ncbi:MAG: ergothioneine biosynthesis protein EgtB [Gammaproteobacteria bacterium]|nr:ergothioneine biosynthesis protein EgtB [Gammaproteobacteria bacterium]
MQELVTASSHSTSAGLLEAYTTIRKRSEDLCAPLEVEDYCAQPIPSVSPPKWHLAHTTWFFETFILQPYLPDYRVFDSKFNYLFNSYYDTIGPYFPREDRGSLSRPLVKEVFEYRSYADEAMAQILANRMSADIDARLRLGLNHEQQHQELIVTDLKYILGKNPLRPRYVDAVPTPRSSALGSLSYSKFSGGVVDVGANLGDADFLFDNESPRHKVFLSPYSLANRVITNGEFREFIQDGGYDQPSLWLSDGWSEKNKNNWRAPEYWEWRDGQWLEYTLGGETDLEPSHPVTHISLYEADAFARWAGARLATEFEWEHAAANWSLPTTVNLAQRDSFHPSVAQGNGHASQMLGDCWEWTSSSYAPYPGFRPLNGALGEYNGKFMANQFVLRGGSCATPPEHIRRSYRNFFYARDRWQFTGIRLAQDG